MVIPLVVLIGNWLKKVPVLGKLVDERFLSHRRRAQRIAGMAGFLLADALLLYGHVVTGKWDRDLTAVVLTVFFVYLLMIVWYLVKE